jgi:2-methylfumaryl-CoA isomerase
MYRKPIPAGDKLVTGILSGMRVIEGSAFVAAPLGGMTLAQLGAEVIRFDPIGGGLDYGRWPLAANGQSLFWAGMNKGKKSIAIDINKPEGREIIAEMICAPGDDAGLFLTNFPARGWLSYDKLKARRADLIYVNITGDRHGGSEVDYTVNPRVGFPNLTGQSDDPRPVNHVLPAWDNITGQMAAVGLLAAERHRRKTGAGQYVKIALLDVALATLGHLGFIAEVEACQQDRSRYGNDLFGAFGRDFLTRDGHRVMVIALTARQWQNLRKATQLDSQFDALGVHLGLDLSVEGNRFKARDNIASLLAPWIAARNYSGVLEIFRDNDVCFGPYQTVRQLVEHDQEASLQNPLFVEREQAGIGRYRMPGSPLFFSSSEHLDAQPAPRLGEHTDEVLASFLGLSSAEIGRLHDQQIVSGPTPL